MPCQLEKLLSQQNHLDQEKFGQSRHEKPHSLGPANSTQSLGPNASSLVLTQKNSGDIGAP